MRRGVKLHLPIFVGEGSNDAVAEELQTFIEDFESYCEATELVAAGRLASLRQCFKKGSEAATWYAAISRDSTKQLQSWDDAKVLMRQRFDVPRTAGQLATLRDTLKQKDKESVRPFADRVTLFQQQVDKKRKDKLIVGVTVAQKRICVDSFSDQDCCLSFLSGLKPAVRTILTQRALPDTFQGLIDAAVLAEVAVAEARAGAGSALHAVDDLGAVGAGGGGGRQGRSGGTSGPEKKKKYPPTNRPNWIRLNQLPRGMCYTCGFSGHSAMDCKTELSNQRWNAVITELNLQQPIRGQKSGGGSVNPVTPQQGAYQQQGGYQQQPVVPQPMGQQQVPGGGQQQQHWQVPPNAAGPSTLVQGTGMGGGGGAGGQGSYADF